MQPAPYDRVILGDLVLPDGVLPGGYVAIRGETIAAIGQGAPPPAADGELEIRELLAIVIDTMPGSAEGSGLEVASALAELQATIERIQKDAAVLPPASTARRSPTRWSIGSIWMRWRS